MTPAKALIDCGKQFYERRWMWGTSGNLSLRITPGVRSGFEASRLKTGPDPRCEALSIAITPSGLNKGHLTPKDLLTITDGRPMPRHPRNLVPSAETVIHQAIYRAVPGAGAVFHVHPVYSTLISSFYGHPKEKRILKVDWFEMMKGLGVGEEESAEVAILPNWQDVSLIARDVTEYLKMPKVLPVVLIYTHGLTGWGRTPDQARNHLEIMEYVCQYLYLKRLAK